MSEPVRDQPTTRERLLDATARVLIEYGQAQVSTRRIAEEAGVAHGLIRYHFDSLDDLMRTTLDRACEEILQRQRELYESDGPFIDKWRIAMSYIDIDLESGFPKLAAELIARSWNDPSWQPVIRDFMAGFDDVLSTAIEGAVSEYELQGVDVAAMTTLLRTFQLGVLMDRVSGVTIGHARLDAVIIDWLETLARASDRPSDAPEDPTDRPPD